MKVTNELDESSIQEVDKRFHQLEYLPRYRASEGIVYRMSEAEAKQSYPSLALVHLEISSLPLVALVDVLPAYPDVIQTMSELSVAEEELTAKSGHLFLATTPRGVESQRKISWLFPPLLEMASNSFLSTPLGVNLENNC